MECKNEKEIENVCKTCGKKYSTKKILKNHIKKIHLGILPFECKQCDKRFQFPSLLKYHEPIHTETKYDDNKVYHKEFVNNGSDVENHKIEIEPYNKEESNKGKVF